MPHLPDHATHDPELIAAYAAGDASGSALADAAELVADCADCAVLHRDLRAIAVALPGLPPAVRPRDFRLTPEQAASLAPSGWRGFLAAFASPRFRLAAPLGTGLAAIGLAGLLLGTPGTPLPTGGAGTTAAEAPSPAASAGDGAAAAGAAPAQLAPVPSAAAGAVDGSGDTGYMPREPLPAASAAAASAAVAPPPAKGAAPAGSAAIADTGAAAPPAPASTVEREMALQAQSPAPDAGTDAGEAPSAPAAQPAPSPWLFVSAGLMIVGIALVGLRFVARSSGRA